MEYRGIKLADSVKLFMKNGDYNQQIKKCLDRLVDLLNENEDEMTGLYINDRTHVQILRKCGHDHTQRPSDYKQGKYCKKCSGHCSEQVKEDFILKVEQEGYILTGIYIDTKTPVFVICPKGHKTTLTPQSFKRNCGCFECGRERTESFHRDRSVQTGIEFAKSVKLNGHTLKSEYKNMYEKVLIDFNCDHGAFWVSPVGYKHGGNRCPNCNQSKGEKIIYDWLISEGIDLKPQRTFDGTKWRYDFFIPSINLLIEVQGLQHYEEVEYFRRNLAEEQENDRQKRTFAESLGYTLIEVDYREHIPALALERFVEQFNKIQENGVLV